MTETSSTGLAHDCRTECFVDFPDEKIIAIAVTDVGETKTVCTGCLPDRIQSPGFYEGEMLYGTHWLGPHTLTALFPDEYPEMNRDLQPRLEHDCRQVCIAEDPARVLIALSVSEDGLVSTVCTGCVLPILTDPAYPAGGLYAGLTLYGSHILAEEMVRYLWPEDFEEN